MTKLERLRNKLLELEQMKNHLLRNNDLVNLLQVEQCIKDVTLEIKEAEYYEPKQLSEVLKNYDVSVKNSIYKALLECSLVADLLNDCAVSIKEELKKIGLDDFHFSKDVAQLCNLSQQIANIAIIPNEAHLVDMLCDNAEYIDKCHDAASEHLQKKLHL